MAKYRAHNTIASRSLDSKKYPPTEGRRVNRRNKLFLYCFTEIVLLGLTKNLRNVVFS